jgi:hypothetical protein
VLEREVMSIDEGLGQLCYEDLACFTCGIIVSHLLEGDELTGRQEQI